MKRTDIKKYRVPVALAAALVGAGLLNGKYEKVQGLDYSPAPSLPPAYVEPLEPVVKAPATIPDLYDQEKEKERRARKIDLSFRALRDYFLSLFKLDRTAPEVLETEVAAPAAPAAEPEGLGTITISAPGFHLVTREEDDTLEVAPVAEEAQEFTEQEEETASSARTKTGGLAVAFALTLLATVFWPLPRLSAKIRERFNVTRNFKLLSLFSKLLTVAMAVGIYFLVPPERRGWVRVFAVLWGIIMLSLSVAMLGKRGSRDEAGASVNQGLETDELAA